MLHSLNILTQLVLPSKFIRPETSKNQHTAVVAPTYNTQKNNEVLLDDSLKSKIVKNVFQTFSV